MKRLNIIFREGLFVAVLFLLGFLQLSQWIGLGNISADWARVVYYLQQLSLGQVVYRDIYDFHFLGYLQVFYLIHQILPLGPESVWYVMLIWSVVLALLNFTVVAALTSIRMGRLAAVSTVTVGWFVGWGGHEFHVEMYLLLPLLAAICCFVRAYLVSEERSLYLGMFFLGTLLSWDQRAVAFLLLPPVMFALVPSFRKVKTVFIGVVAGSVIPGVCLAYLMSQGALQAFFVEAIQLPVSYRVVDSWKSLGFIRRAIRVSFQGEGLSLGLSLLGYLLFLRFSVRKGLGRLILSLLVSCFLFASLGGQPNPHYLLIFSPLVVWGMVFGVWYAARLRIARQWRVVPLVLVLVVVALRVGYSVQQSFRHGISFEPGQSFARTVGEYIAAHSNPNESILIWGDAPQIYLFSNRQSNFDEIGLLSVVGGNSYSVKETRQGVVPERVQKFRQYLQESPPAIFVYYYLDEAIVGRRAPLQRNFRYKTVSHLEYLREFIQGHYELVEMFSQGGEKAEVYRRSS